MDPLQVAGAQIDIEWEAPTANRARADRWIARAQAGGARLVVLPEMFATGFSMAASAMAAHADETTAWAQASAKAHGVWLICGLATPGTGSGRPRNTALTIDPTGVVRGRYDKIHPFSLAREHEHFDGGDQVQTVEIEGVGVTPLICYDLRFPEVFRPAAHDTDLFVVIANWPTPRREHWRTLLRARAIENQAFVLGVNRVGDGDKLHYSGDSALYDPLGEARSSASISECLVAGAVAAEAVREVRKRFSFLADRRPEVYPRMQGSPMQGSPMQGSPTRGSPR